MTDIFLKRWIGIYKSFTEILILIRAKRFKVISRHKYAKMLSVD